MHRMPVFALGPALLSLAHVQPSRRVGHHQSRTSTSRSLAVPKRRSPAQTSARLHKQERLPRLPHRTVGRPIPIRCPARRLSAAPWTRGGWPTAGNK
eukprot:scaffold36300_cov123-Isochrysis_galbana.AAC.2